MSPQIYPIAIYVVVTIVGRFISQGQRKPRHSLQLQSREILKDWTAILVALSAAIAIAWPVLEAALREDVKVSVYTRVGGLLAMVVGWGVAYAGNRTIAASWSPTIAKDKAQELVTSGIYATVRHPLYLSGLLILVGTNVYFGSRWAWLGAAVGFISIVIRIPIEERQLVQRFGQEYVDYQKRTQALVPWIW